jgi:hypothetical protein
LSPFSGNHPADSRHSINDDVTSTDNDVIHYRIPVQDGKSVVVRVQENTKLLAPGAVVEHRTRKYMNASDSHFQTLHHQRGCHLTGFVLGEDVSKVALTACDGLVSSTINRHLY